MQIISLKLDSVAAQFEFEAGELNLLKHNSRLAY